MCWDFCFELGVKELASGCIMATGGGRCGAVVVDPLCRTMRRGGRIVCVQT